ncbi:MAG: methyltransferase [Pseudobdellovibrio sp.]
MSPTCTYFLKCSGCDWWNKSYQEQSSEKIQNLKSILQEEAIEFLSAGEYGLRHRTDFTIQYDEDLNKHLIGFYDNNKKIMQIDTCLQMSAELQKVYSEFTQISFYYGDTPLKKGSVRLRVSPQGLKGCWLDFSNIEIKHFLEDQVLLRHLLDAGFIVEMGQKGKRLVRENGILKLASPIPEAWFKTQTIPLKCLISDFTQPSWNTSDLIVETVISHVKELKLSGSILEFGSGIGQFSLAFLKEGFKLTCCEINASSAEQLLSNVEGMNNKNNLNLLIGDFHKKTIENSNFDLVFVNPARSGLKNFTQEIAKTNAEYLIYVSCFPESMAQDLSNLPDYKICNIKIIDQFPQTHHYEVCALLKKLS